MIRRSKDKDLKSLHAASDVHCSRNVDFVRCSPRQSLYIPCSPRTHPPQPYHQSTGASYLSGKPRIRVPHEPQGSNRHLHRTLDIQIRYSTRPNLQRAAKLLAFQLQKMSRRRQCTFRYRHHRFPIRHHDILSSRCTVWSVCYSVGI